MAMTSAAVLYDRITDSGVFVKRSGVGVSLRRDSILLRRERGTVWIYVGAISGSKLTRVIVFLYCVNTYHQAGDV